MINKNTTVCISLASRASDFGTTLHNAGYAALGLNFIYKAFEVSDLAGALAGVRALNIRGCSLSMPFKETALPLLDDLDATAKMIGAVNTIVNEAGTLVGYNTDAFGAREVLNSVKAKPGERVLMLGAGGVARAVIYALRQLGFARVQVSNRDPKRIERLNSILPCDVVPWSRKQDARADVLINATSIGMSPNVNQSPMEAEFLNQFRAIVDVVATPLESRLIKLARSMGKQVAPGYLMSLEQLIEQFRLYSGELAPRDVLERKLVCLLEN